MDIKQLEYFAALCQYKTFSKAAEALFISQQGLSASIARMEQELGCQLLVRNAKGTELTIQGRIVEKRALQILQNHGEMVKELEESMDEQRIPYPVCGSFGTIMRLGDGIHTALQQAYPSIDLILEEHPEKECEDLVAKGSFELGFSTSPISDNLFDKEYIVTESFHAVMHKSHPLAKRSSITIPDLAKDNILIMDYRFHTYHQFMNLCQLHGFHPTMKYQTSQIAVLFHYVQKKMGIGITNCFLAKLFATDEMVTIPIEEHSFNWNLFLIWKKGNELSTTARQLHSFLKTYISENTDK